VFDLVKVVTESDFVGMVFEPLNLEPLLVFLGPG
jgi:hypothetical protein